MDDKLWLVQLAKALRDAELEGPLDEPEGAQVIQLSYTFANQIADRLESIAASMEVDANVEATYPSTDP